MPSAAERGCQREAIIVQPHFVERLLLVIRESSGSISLTELSSSFSGEAVSSADLIIEAIIESIKIKRDLFGFLDGKASRGCIFASNTSSLSIKDIAEACSPERQAR